MPYTVKAVADLASVSVRTLHHYDHIGLLKPASVSPAGYRLYTDADMERLQQILFFRELGFALGETKAILASPNFDRKQALREHRRLLLEKQRRPQRLIQSVDRTIDTDTMERGVTMAQESRFEGFDESKLEEYKQEARARWGKEATEGERRTAKYTKADWDAIKAEGGAINEALAALIDRDPADPEVQQWLERWFRLINEGFYTCTLEIFRGLGSGYVEDERFAAFYENIRPGLAKFMRDAMHAYRDKLGATG